MPSKLTRVGCFSLGVCMALTVSKGAWAQPEAGAAPATAPSAPVSAEVLKEAGERYTRGLALYGDGEFLLALVEFERAYQLSNNYKVLFNIGQVRMQLGRYAKAKEALEQYLKAGGSNLTAERTQAVNKDLATLAERTAILNVVTAEAGADISLDGKVIATSPLKEPLIVDAGEHNLVLHKSGFYDAAQSVTLAGHDQIEIKIDLKPIPLAAATKPADTLAPPVIANKPAHTLMWASWAATGAFAATAGLTGYFGIQKANDLETMRTQYPASRAELDKTEKQARTLLTISTITTGLAVAAGGAALYFTLKKPSEKPAAGSVAVGIAPDGLRLRGSF